MDLQSETGGQGENPSPLAAAVPTADGHHDRADLRLLRRAVKRWDVPDRARNVVPEAMTQLVETDEDGRVRCAAAKVLLECEKQNQSDEHRREDLARLDNGQLAPGGVTFVIRCKDDPKDDSKPELPSVSG